MGNGNLNVGTFEMYYRIERIGSHAVAEQVDKTVTREDALAVEHYYKSRIQVGIVTQQSLYVGIAELKIAIQRIVGSEGYVCTVLIVGTLRNIADKNTLLELGYAHDTVTVAAHLETGACRVHGLETDTVKTNRFLEHRIIVLGTGIELAHSLYHHSLRYASAVVTHCH